MERPRSSGPGSLEDPLGPSLTWALTRSLPGREEIWLLKAILHRGPVAQEAWQAFSARISDLPSLFRTDTGGRKRLSPLLLSAIRQNQLPADPRLLTVLRTAYLREELRVGAYRKIAGEAYEALRAQNIRFMVLKGAALSETVYPEPHQRHAHDIDLLLPEEELGRAENALVALGLSKDPSLAPKQGIGLRHRSELPILLLSRLYRYPFYRSEFDRLWARSEGASLGGSGEVRVLSPGDNLLHALGHASYCPSRSNLAWVTDAWMILHARQEVDWAAFASAVRESRLELPAFVMLRYLKDEMGAPVPDEALRGLAGDAASAGDLRRDVALFGARQYRGRHPELSDLVRAGWKQKLDLLRWQLFPSREYIEWAYGAPPSVLIPVIYLMRPLAHAARSLKMFYRAQKLRRLDPETYR